MFPVALLLAAAATSAGDEVIARADSATVTADAFARRAAALRGAGREPKPEAILEDLIDEALMAADAERMGLGRDPRIVERVESARLAAAAEVFLEREVASGARVDEATVRQIFHGRADTVRLKIVLLPDEGEARAALARLQHGSDLAREARASLHSSARSGGDAGTVARADLEPPLERVAFAAEPGRWTGPVPLELGFAVFQVTDRHLGDEAGYRAKREALRSFAEEQARTQVRRHVLEQLRRRSGVQVDAAFLDSTRARLEATGGEADQVIARVGRRALRYVDVLADLGDLSRGKSGPHLSGPSVKKEIAWARVDRMLLEDAATALGHDRDPRAGAAAAAVRRDELALAWAVGRHRPARAPSEAEIEAYYRGHLSEFQRPARRACSQIVARSQDEAERLRRRVAAGEPFEAVARQESRDQATALQGGFIGEIGYDRLEAVARGGEEPLARAIREARPGEPTLPVPSRLGWHVLRCDAARASGPAPLDEVRSAIAGRLSGEHADRALRDAITSLRSRAAIAIDRGRLARAVAALH